MRYRDFIGSIDPKPAIVAHKGHWLHAPENSLAAIEAAIEAGFEIAELDVQKSADGVFFLMHDELLTRMVGAEYPCKKMPISQLQVMPLRQRNGGIGAGFSHHAIPTLAEAMKLAKGRIFLDLDVKHLENMIKVAKLVAEMDMQDEVAIKISVQSEKDARYLVALEEEYDLMVMPRIRFDAHNCRTMIGLLKSVAARIVEAQFDSLYTLVSHRANFEAANIDLWVNTVNSVASGGFSDEAALNDPDAIWGSLTEAGIAVIQTDEPDALYEWRRGLTLALPDAAATEASHLSF